MKDATEGEEENDELVDFPLEIAQGFQDAFISIKDPWISEALDDDIEDSSTYLALFKAIGGQIGKEKFEKVRTEE